MKTFMQFSGTAARVDLHAIPHDDPIAYAFGFMQGVAGEARAKGRDLAEGYKKGFAHGKRVREGKDEMPAWAEKASAS